MSAPTNAIPIAIGAKGHMTAMVSICLIIGGLFLLIHGIESSRSLASLVSRPFTDNPADCAMWLLLCGAASAMIGVAGLIHARRA